MAEVLWSLSSGLTFILLGCSSFIFHFVVLESQRIQLPQIYLQAVGIGLDFSLESNCC